MFSDRLLESIFIDERLRHVPFEYQSAVLNTVYDAMEKRFYTESPDLTREEILNDICNRD